MGKTEIYSTDISTFSPETKGSWFAALQKWTSGAIFLRAEIKAKTIEERRRMPRREKHQRARDARREVPVSALVLDLLDTDFSSGRLVNYRLVTTRVNVRPGDGTSALFARLENLCAEGPPPLYLSFSRPLSVALLFSPSHLSPRSVRLRCKRATV